MISRRSARRFVVSVAERVAVSSPASPIAVPPLTPGRPPVRPAPQFLTQKNRGSGIATRALASRCLGHFYSQGAVERFGDSLEYIQGMPLIVGIFKSGNHGVFGAYPFGQFLLS